QNQSQELAKEALQTNISLYNTVIMLSLKWLLQ
ncbi:unnamed protein product, partial [marine sediment metagenome]